MNLIPHPRDYKDSSASLFKLLNWGLLLSGI